MLPIIPTKQESALGSLSNPGHLRSPLPHSTTQPNYTKTKLQFKTANLIHCTNASAQPSTSIRKIIMLS